MESHTDSDVYHAGEIAVQRRVGVRERAVEMSGMVDRAIPDSDDVHDLVAGQPHAVVTSVDGDGCVWVSFLTGEPGFIAVEDDRTVRFDADPAAGDPLNDHLRPQMPVGVLLVDPRDRNRLRLNGTATPQDRGFEITTEEVFPNCPKYIQCRSFERLADGESSPGKRHTHDGLTAAHREWIGTADTFFIGSYHPDAGADASHRGGDPGFVDGEGNTIIYPDYPGNSMFCTLGNIEATAQAGLLFVDFDDGRVLQLTGQAEVIWDETRVAAYEGAERLVELTVERAIELPNGNPLRWSLEERSPFNP